MALHCVEEYCRKFGLAGPATQAFFDDLWNLPPVDGPDAFFRWERDHAALVYVGLGDPYPAGYEDILSKAGVDPLEFRELLMWTVEIVFSNFYGAADHEATMADAALAFHIARSHGIEPPDASLFAASRWRDRNGFGNALTVAERDRWRSF